MQTFVIKSSWFTLAPHGRMDARFWAAVTNTLNAVSVVDPAMATNDQVKLAIEHVKQKSSHDLRDARAKRDQANALLSEARALEAGAFADIKEVAA